jgi:hypothetical protein
MPGVTAGQAGKAGTEGAELYNLKDDPGEQKPLGRKHPMYDKLFTALQGHITEAGAVPWQRYPVDLKDL